MNLSSNQVLESLFRTNGLGWMIDMYVPRDGAVAVYSSLLDRVAVEYRSRFESDFQLTPEVLQAQAQENPHKVQAFLQLLRPSSSPEMLVMALRVLQGSAIREVTMSYRELESFRLCFVLASQDDNGAEILETYESTDILDCSLLRHLGAAKMDERPYFAGIYALRLGEESA